MWRDLERICAQHDLPFRRPTRFPRNGLLAARVACLAAEEPWCPDFVRAVYRANFAEDREIADPETIAGILDALGQPARDTIAQAQTPAAKERLRRQTEEAVALGVFGAPTWVVDGELFWGTDRLDAALARAARGSGERA
jgi:2-hydroxychromene-2-carboxylate isomerase